MVISKNLSAKITILSFVAMVSVVCIHASGFSSNGDMPQWTKFISIMISKSFARFAVPFFFVVSGFFFCQSKYMNSGDKNDYLILIKKKFHSLLIPYLLWCIYGAIVVTPLVYLSNKIADRPPFERTVLGFDNCYENLNALIGLFHDGPLGNPPLWYVRVLLIFFCVAPVWRLLIKIKCIACLIVVFCLFGPWCYFYLPVLFVPVHAVGWFLLGIMINRYNIIELKVPTPLLVASAFVYLIVGLFMCSPWLSLTSIPNIYERCCYLEGFFGIIFYWGIYDILNKGIISDYLHSEQTLNIAKANFWVFCMHNPIICYLNICAQHVPYSHPIFVIVSKLLIVMFTILFCYGTYYTIRKFCPHLVKILMGGR